MKKKGFHVVSRCFEQQAKISESVPPVRLEILMGRP